MEKNDEKKDSKKKEIKGEFLELGVTVAGLIAVHGLVIGAASALGFPLDLLTESGAEYYNETGGKHLF